MLLYFIQGMFAMIYLHARRGGVVMFKELLVTGTILCVVMRHYVLPELRINTVLQ